MKTLLRTLLKVLQTLVLLGNKGRLVLSIEGPGMLLAASFGVSLALLVLLLLVTRVLAK